MTELLETICVRITNLCNLSCSHCWAGSSPKTNASIDLSLLEKFLLETRSLGLKHVSISGGEPGIDKRIGKFSKWLLDHNFYTTITTNGLSSLVDNLKSSHVIPNKSLRIYVSIDGAKKINDLIRGQGCFDKAINELVKIKDWADWVGINTVILPEVYKSLKELIPVIKPIEVDRWALITPIPKGAYKYASLNNSAVIKVTKQSKIKIKSLGFEGSIVVYNFIETPHTSILIDSDGTLKLPGIKEGDDIVIDNLKDYKMAIVKEAIRTQNQNKKKTHFTWNHWESNL